MPHRFLEHSADVAFRAWGDTLPELFAAAGDAVMEVMVADLKAIQARTNRPLLLEDQALDLLLFQFLQEFIYYKDAEQLLLRSHTLEVQTHRAGYTLKGELRGEPLDPRRHELLVDVKAVTLHRFKLERHSSGWRTRVILDV